MERSRDGELESFEKDCDVRLVELSQDFTDIVRETERSNKLQRDCVEIDVDSLVTDLSETRQPSLVLVLFTLSGCRVKTVLEFINVFVEYLPDGPILNLNPSIEFDQTLHIAVFDQ